MSEEIEKHIHRKYEITQKLGKGVRSAIGTRDSLPPRLLPARML